jgi:nucleoid-associated protein YgaU
MPEPVVIIGPAARPAGPAGMSAENAADADAADSGVELQNSPQSDDRKRSPLLLALARVATGLSTLVGRGIWALAKGGLSLAGRYPRHSLAAGASILILGAVLYTQLRSGKSDTELRSGTSARSPVIASIGGDPAAVVAEGGTNAAPTKKNEVIDDGATKNSGHGANSNGPGKTNPNAIATASSDASHPSDRSSNAPAPERTALDDAPPPLPSVADAPASGHERQATPGESASPGELAASPKAEPPPAAPASEHDQAPATLLTQSPAEPAPLPSPSAIKGNLSSADPVGIAAAPSPVTTADLSPPPTQTGEPPSVPAPTGDPLQLAAALEPVGDEKRSNPPSAPDPVRPDPTNKAPSSPGTAGQLDRKATDDEKRARPTLAQESHVEGKSVPAHNPESPTTVPESTKKEPVNSEGAHPTNQEAEKAATGTDEPAHTPNGSAKKEPVNSDGAHPTNQDVEKAATGTVEPAHSPKGSATVPIPDESMPPHSEPSSSAKPSVETSAPLPEAAGPGTESPVAKPATPAPVPPSIGAPPDSRFETLNSKTQDADHKSPAPESNLTQATESREPEKASPQNTPQAAKSEERSPEGTSPDTKAKPGTLAELTSAGWVSVPNSGKMVIDGGEVADSPRGDSASRSSADPFARRDVRAHAAKDVNFEQESPRSQAAQDAPKSGQSSHTGVAAAVETRSRLAAERVESVPHVVERNENFWTISRLYYSSGRYYRALWKANAAKYPEIDKVTINDVIMIPPVEELDPAFIDPPRTIAPAALGGATPTSNGRSRTDSADLAESSISASSINRDGPVSTTRTNRGSGEGVPVRRSSRTDPDLDLPAPEAVTRRDRATDRVGHRPEIAQRDGNDDNEPETRTAARPRAGGPAPLRSPVYKVRQYDTLRSIARDMLGDSHRASEILDLNRDLIDDPTHLIVGQVLEMPEDARTTVRR